MNTNLLDLNNDVLNIIGDWARQLNSQANRTEKETGTLAGRATWLFC
jgi:hypothetical protein